MSIVSRFLDLWKTKEENSRYYGPIIQRVPYLDIVIPITGDAMHKTTLFRLSLVCRDLHRLVLPFIENMFTFRLPKNERFKIIYPKNVQSDSFRNLPPKITNLNFEKDPFVPLPPSLFSFLPSSLTHLTIGGDFNQPLHCLPYSITHLIITSPSFNCDLDYLPHSLTHLTVCPLLSHLKSSFEEINLITPYDTPEFTSFFGYHQKDNNFQVWSAPSFRTSSYTQPLHYLPPNLTHLTLALYPDYRYCFDYLPPELTHFSICTNTYIEMENLPDSLTHLFVNIPQSLYSNALNHLPSSLTHLFIATKNYFYEIHNNEDDLPPSLSHLCLTLGLASVDYLPSSLTFLQISYSSQQCSLDNLPPNLTVLNLNLSHDEFPHFDNLPPSLTQLYLSSSNELPELNNSLDYLPSSLKLLRLKFTQIDIPLDHLPSELSHLIIESSFNCSLDYLPESLVSLSLAHCSYGHLDYLPSSLTHLSLSNEHSTLYFPPSLTHLTLRGFIMPVPPTVTHLTIFSIHKELNLSTTTQNEQGEEVTIYPPSLQHLHVEGDNDLLKDYIPPDITSLYLAGGYNSRLPYLPSSLTSLHLGCSYSHSLPQILPHSLTQLSLSSIYKHPIDIPPSCFDVSRKAFDVMP